MKLSTRFTNFGVLCRPQKAPKYLRGGQGRSLGAIAPWP